MLVLTRKRAEMIQIGENIRIKVIRTGRSTVKIGVEAPDDVRVLRGELCGTPAPKPTCPNREDSLGDQEEETRLVGVWSDQFPHPHISRLGRN